MQSFYELLDSSLGLSASELSLAQMGLRAAIVYIIALLMVRIVGNRRFAGKYAAIDIILGIMLGATLSQAIVNASAFFPVLGAALVLVTMHWLIATLSYRSSTVESWVKGAPRPLIRDGQANRAILRKTSITKKDLDMVLRSQGQVTSLKDVSLAILEPGGSISVIAKNSGPSSELEPEQIREDTLQQSSCDQSLDD